MSNRGRLYLISLALVCGLAAATPALAQPHLSRGETREISALVNRFVNDVVLRRNLADGWLLADSNLRGSTRRAAWVAGRAVTVEQFPVRGRDFRESWYANWATAAEIGLTVSLPSGRGASREVIEENVVLAKHGGRWLVDTFYPNGIFRLGQGHSGSCASSKCAVTGLYDFGAAGPGEAARSGSGRIGSYWLWVGLGTILGAPLALLAGAGLRANRRYRRARSAYAASRSA